MKWPFRRRKQDAGISLQTAEQMLANVFRICGREPNTMPLEALSSYSNYRKERYALQRAVIAAVLALFMLLPLLFLAADIRVSLSNPDGGGNPVYAVSVSTRIPIRQIQAHMGGRTVPIYEISPNEYMIQPRDNGDMDISVTLLNCQETSVELAVSAVDMDAPRLLSTDMDENNIYLYLEDAGSGVDYASVRIVDSDGRAILPDWDADAGCIILAYPDRVLDVRIPDLRGNALQVELKPEG